MIPNGPLRGQFEEQGFIGPIGILSKEECKEALCRLRNSAKPAVWPKGNAVSSPFFYELATRKEILDLVKTFLGEDILLWGACLVRKDAGSVHPWHCDVECSGAAGRSVTVWIGLDKTNPDSSLQLLSYSHRLGKTAQQVASEAGKERGNLTTDEVLEWAHRHDSRCRVEKFGVKDGDALLFNVKLWHHSENRNTAGTRTALLLQYATPATEIRVRAKGEYDWPFRFSKDRPPCIVVSGNDRAGVNQTVSPPETDPIWPCWIKAVDSLVFETKQDGWKIGHIFHGPTSCMKKLSSHVSVLDEGKTPHEPHVHKEEELLILLSGTVDIIRVDDTSQARTVERLTPGSFIYHAAYQGHTIHSVGPGPATYLMFKWKGTPNTDEGERLKSSAFHIWSGKEKQRPGYKRIGIFQSPTLYLNNLRSHLSVLEPGAGYPPHGDEYDVAILVLSGDLETLNRQVGPHSVIFYPANELHGMKNTGNTEATYLVFEFHGNRKDRNKDN